MPPPSTIRIGIVVIGTCDTKLQELLLLRDRILDCGGKVILVDAGRKPTHHNAIDVSQETLTTRYAPSDNRRNDLSSLPRGEVIKYMTACAINWLREAYHAGEQNPDVEIHGIISAGGTGGTALASGVMRAVLPLGFPKLIISTNASADVSHVVGETDITMMPSIVDIAGSNELLKQILSNAAGAIVGMGEAYLDRLLAKQQVDSRMEDSDDDMAREVQRKRVGITMFGVTTPCCDVIRKHLEANYDVEIFVFHCTGTGGKAMERLVREGGLDAVIDVTTTEICDYIAGGVMSAGSERLVASLEAGIPYIISVGATDMVNFGPIATVPEKYQDRELYEHNPTVTLMRTSVEESRAVGQFIVDKITKHSRNQAMVKVVLPTGGVSMIATPGGPFYDAEADRALFQTVISGLEHTKVDVKEDGLAINDAQFAVDLAQLLVQMMGLNRA